jgi:hypothetical protein
MKVQPKPKDGGFVFQAVPPALDRDAKSAGGGYL